jgi:hypothetical protein
MGIASEDITGDGLPEVMLTSMGDQLLQLPRAGIAGARALRGGGHRPPPHVGDDGRPSTGWHAPSAMSTMTGARSLHRQGQCRPDAVERDARPQLAADAGPDGTVRRGGRRRAWPRCIAGRGAALADLNRDGRLDLVVVNRRAPMELWQNRDRAATGSPCAAPGRPNGHAVGAWVELRRGDGVAAREITVGGGHAGGTAGPVHFGLGAARSPRSA